MSQQHFPGNLRDDLQTVAKVSDPETDDWILQIGDVNDHGWQSGKLCKAGRDAIKANYC